MTTAIRIEAFTESERGKLVQPESPLIDWTIRGTDLAATVKLEDGLEYEVEVETAYADEAIESSLMIDVYRLEPVEPVRGGGPYIVQCGQHFKRRHLSQPANEHLFKMLHESADEFIETHSYSLCVAHDRMLEEERAEGAMVEEAGMR